MSTPHAKLRKEITDWLKSIGAWYVCTNSQGYGRKGIPDILACIRGKFVAIEVKVLPDTPSPWQMRELKAIQDACGTGLIAYSLDAVKKEFLTVGWKIHYPPPLTINPEFVVRTEDV